MSSSLEKCNEFSRRKPVRIFIGILLTIICCIGIYHLLDASNEMNEHRLQKFEVLPAEKGSLIYVKDDAHTWTEKIDEFLKPYKTPHPNRQQCDYDNPPAPGKVCDFDVNDLGPCTTENYYGYNRKTPCVFLKLRQNPEWKPEFINATDLPNEMPKDLKEYIQNGGKKQVAWVSCEGENPASDENIGPIKYLPERGFRSYQFPTTKESLEPFVVVFFQKPQTEMLIIVKCTLWTRNSADSVTFKLMIDKNWD